MDAADVDAEREDDAFKSWEGAYQRSWDVLQEDQDGSLHTAVNSLQQQLKRRRVKQIRQIRRGIIRHVVLVIDLSRAMEERDLAPSRLELTLTLAESFLAEFFDQNPISQVGIVVTRDAAAEKLTELSGNPAEHMRLLRENKATVGEPSLQNALELARQSLAHVPKHGSREIILIVASLTTCDPGNIFHTIDALKQDRVRCSVIGLSAELHVCRTLARETNGEYHIVLHDQHMREVLLDHVVPPPVTAATTASDLVIMGFPVRKQETHASLCSCHQRWTFGGYICPRCLAKVCDLPSECPTCALTLVSSPHLARSYHHLLPLEPFKEQPPAGTKRCGACDRPVARGENVFACPRCSRAFCIDCDVFIHDVLHNCPGCV